MNVSPTDAKTVALHFLNATTDGRNTPFVIAKTIKQAKTLLSVGYTADEVCEAIDHIVKKGVNMYSFGYINAVISDVLKEVEAKKAKEQQKIELARRQGEVNANDESTERNRQKLGKFGLQSGEREKRYLDLFT